MSETKLFSGHSLQDDAKLLAMREARMEARHKAHAEEKARIDVEAAALIASIRAVRTNPPKAVE